MGKLRREMVRTSAGKKDEEGDGRRRCPVGPGRGDALLVARVIPAGEARCQGGREGGDNRNRGSGEILICGGAVTSLGSVWSTWTPGFRANMRVGAEPRFAGLRLPVAFCRLAFFRI